MSQALSAIPETSQAEQLAAPDGIKLGIIRTPEIPANLTVDGPDLRTLFFTARTSVYTLRVKVPERPHPWYASRR